MRHLSPCLSLLTYLIVNKIQFIVALTSPITTQEDIPLLWQHGSCSISVKIVPLLFCSLEIIRSKLYSLSKQEGINLLIQNFCGKNCDWKVICLGKLTSAWGQTLHKALGKYNVDSLQSLFWCQYRKVNRKTTYSCQIRKRWGSKLFTKVKFDKWITERIHDSLNHIKTTVEFPE